MSCWFQFSDATITLVLKRYDAELDATAVALPLHSFIAENEQFFSSSPKKETIDALSRAGQLSLVLVMPGSSSQFQVSTKQYILNKIFLIEYKLINV